MNDHEHDPEPEGTAISVGDGSLGGAAIGGSVGGPDSGVIKDPVGPEVAIPLGAPADESAVGIGSDDERAVRDAALERADPLGGRESRR
jgi:hypothetical protein